MSSEDLLGLATRVVTLATLHGLRIAVAESLTGGLVVASLVAVPGASRVVNGGIVAYDTELKTTLLGVDPVLLRERGPVDGEVAAQMASGVRDVCQLVGSGAASIGVSTTGVAGPDPDPQTGQPVGTVWLGVSSGAGARSMLLEGVSGDRQAIRLAAVRGALELLLEELGSIA